MNDPVTDLIPDWLPGLVFLSGYGGNWDRYLDAAYGYFVEDFIKSKPHYEGKRFSLKRHPVKDGKEATFWHLIQEGGFEEDRLPNLRRSERIRWPKPMIETIETDKIKTWQNERKGKTRILIAIDDFSYVVILEDREEFILLWTAYYVEREHRRHKLKKEYENYKKG